MAALVEGHNYGLSSENSTSVHKSIIHCKLTDSALKALEEFQRIKDATGRKPTIQFQGQHGLIKVPMLKSSDSPEGLRTFTFSLSPVTADPKGSFECIKQDDARREQELDLLGAMSHKVSVQGTDDSYRQARERMNKAEEDSKKQRAKEIKPGSGMRIKKVVRKPNPAPNTSLSAPQKPSANTFKTIAPPGRSVGQRETLSAPIPHPAHVPSHSQRLAAPPTLLSKTHPNLNKTPTSTSSNQSKPSPTSNFSKPALSSNHNAIINMPFRDRIIHLLAIRPYKNVEILMRLQKDGIKEKDKSALSSVLTQVGTYNPRDKNYSLAKHIFSDVRADWPHYTEVDRQILKRKMNQLQEPSLTASTSPAVSPCHSTGSQGSPNNSQKRVIEEEEKATDHPQKKQRIAHSNHGNKSDSNPNKAVVPGNKSSIISSPNLVVSPESPSNQENNNSLDAGHVVKPDYTRKYGTISSKDQRQRYKSEFNAEYDEYRSLHSKIEQITKRFIDLKDQLNRQAKETENYKNVRKLIMSEYKTVKGDSKYLEQRKRHDYLHHKLGHIKKLITEFDQSRLAVS